MLTLLRKALFLGIHFILALVVLELCARTDDALTWHAPFWGKYSEEMLFVTDSLGYHLRPGGQFQKWKINSFGFRGPEITEAKPAGVKRIITVGASETFGLYESAGMDYPAQLQTLLDQVEPGKYQVLNAGIPGISPSRIEHYFTTWLQHFSPDIIIYYPTPSFIFEAGQAPPDWRKFRNQPPRFEFSMRIVDRFKELYKRTAPARVQAYFRQRLIDRAVHAHPPDWVVTSVPPDKVVVFQKELASLVRTVRAGGSEIVLATHGSRLLHGDSPEEKELLLAARKQSPDKSEGCILATESEANKAVLGVGQDLNVPVIDINAVVPKSSKYFADLGHFTNDGATLVANAFRQEILKLSGEISRDPAISTTPGGGSDPAR